MTPEVVITGDGSSTIFNSEIGEHYHSTFGALTESLHVFISNGYNQLPGTDPVSILEVGFGTGLNALLTLIEAAKQQRMVNYDALEPFPLDPAVIPGLNYPLLTGQPDTNQLFYQMHACPWNVAFPLSPGFLLHKMRIRIEDAVLPDNRYHLVYFDAFSPNVQPELWQNEIFLHLYRSMAKGGDLLTYCAKGTVARSMKENGFIVSKLPGPPGKRHILRGRK